MSGRSSAASAAGISASSAPACELCGNASATQDAARYSRTTGRTFPATTTCESCGVPRGRKHPTFSAAGLPASPSAAPVSNSRKPTLVGSGPSSAGWLTSFDHDTSSWRTSQVSLTGEWEMFSETWPRAGLMRNGTVYERQTSAPRTRANASGLWPTPRENMGRHRVSWSRARSGEHRSNLEDFIGTLWLAAGLPVISGAVIHPTFLCSFMGFPSRWLPTGGSGTPLSQPLRSGSAGES
jgi:hypothetical protein